MNEQDRACGWVVFCCPRNKNRAVDEPCLDPLSYGRSGEPWPEQLLRRGRGTMFPSKEAALSALQETAKKCKGDAWLKDFAFTVLEVTSWDWVDPNSESTE